MQSPPPPPPKAASFHCNGSGTLPLLSLSPSPRNGDDHYYVCSMEEETPLIGSSRKKQGYIVGKSTGSTYGGSIVVPRQIATSIPEVPVITSTSTMNSHQEGDNDMLDDHENDELLSVSSTTSSVASFSTVSSLAENFKESLLLPFTDEDGTNVGRGLLALTVVGTLLGILLQQASSQYHKSTTTPTDDRLTTAVSFLGYISSICGYNYLILWSVCFYPQAIQNYRQQSTTGVSHDFALLNVMGWTYYSIYLSCLYFLPDINRLYQERFHATKSTVAFNDVLFATHATCMALVYVFQILYYSKNDKSKRRRRADKRRPAPTNTTNGSSSSKKSINKAVCKCPVSSMPKLKLKNMTKLLVTGMIAPTIIFPAIISANVSTIPITWLDYLYMLSYFKIACTLTKYTKQVYFNYKRASTKGWNIWYNFLEASGGTLSMLQIALDAFIVGDISGITGNMAKFLLGFATIVFDMIFFMQHYVWYATDKNDDDEHDNDKGADAGAGGNSAAPSKRIPRHLRANSRFEIAIFPTSPVHGQFHNDAYGTINNHHNIDNNSTNPLSLLRAVPERENDKSLMHRAQSDLSLDSSTTTNRSNEYIGRL